MKFPPISSPDSYWEASDHHRTGVKDEIVFDPWDPEDTTGSGKNIGVNNKEETWKAGAEGSTRDSASKEMSSSESDEPQDILASEDKTGTERTSTVDAAVPVGSEDKEDRNALEKAAEDMVCADVEPMELADDILSSNQDRLDDDLIYEIEGDESEYSESDDSVQEGSDLFSEDIPEFDEDAQQTPWEIEPEEGGQSIRRARDKAADLASLLYLTSRDDQEIALAYLTDLFEHPDYSHSSTFQAIKRIASGGLDFETLKAMVELRSIWRQRTDWWKGRYSWRYRVRRLSNGATAFTWVAAHRVCLERKDYPPEMMIDDDWIDEWLRLPPWSPRDCYMSFSSYIEVKIQNFDAELLNYGSSQRWQCEKGPDALERTTATAAHSVPEIDLWRGKGKRK